MFFPTETQQAEPPPGATWPSVPPSLHHGSSDVAEEKRSVVGLVTRPHSDASQITPWLGLRSRLAQIPINRWSLLLLLVLAQLLMLLARLNMDLSDARSKAMSACTKVEDIGSSMASMPHYLSVGVNQLAADGISKAVQGMVEILMMILTGLQNLIIFVIEFQIGTFLCLSTAIVDGVLEFAEFATNQTAGLMNNAINDIAHGINSASSSITSTLDTIKNNVGVFSSSLAESIPDLTGVTDEVSKLSDVKIDTSSITSGINEVQKAINYTNVKNLAEEAISTPFSMIKQALNESYGSWKFDQSVFPVAAEESISFCSDNSTLDDFFEALFKIATTAKIAVIVILVFLAVAAGAVMAWWEVKRFNRQLDSQRMLMNREPMDVVYIAGRTLTAGIGIWISQKLARDPKRQILIRWVIAYATTYTALFVLTLAILGAFSCFCQWIIMRAVQKEAPALAAKVGNFAGDVVLSLEAASTKWANDSNSVILGFQDEINRDVLGYVVNATEAANDTINTFNKYMQDGLNTAFGSVPQLEKVVSSVIHCLIGSKLDTVQEGLGWARSHAHVTLPLFPDDIFAVGANDSISGNSNTRTFLSSPTSSTTDEVTGAVDSVVNKLRNAIIEEALISLALFLLYVAYVLFAVTQAAIRCCLS